MGGTDLKEIGLRISKQRKRLGLTQEQLAERMEVSVQMISNLERGVKAIRIDNLVRVSRILDVTTDYILTGQRSAEDLARLAKRIGALPDDKRGLIETVLTYFEQS